MDLGDPRCTGKADQERFLRRVFAGTEIDDIRSAAEPETALWIRWAAKEAAFKVVSKLLGSPPPFEHAAFHVTVAPPERGAAPRGVVRYRDLEVPFDVQAGTHWIHVIAREAGAGDSRTRLEPGTCVIEEPTTGSPGAWRETLADRFSGREWAAIHSLPSARVRLRARAALARALSVAESSIEVVCDEGPPGRSVPRVLLNGREARADVSLSHHHRLVAWAIAVPARSGAGQASGPGAGG